MLLVLHKTGERPLGLAKYSKTKERKLIRAFSKHSRESTIPYLASERWPLVDVKEDGAQPSLEPTVLKKPAL